MNCDGKIPSRRKIVRTARSSEHENSIPYAQPFLVSAGSSDTIRQYIFSFARIFCAFIDKFNDEIVAMQVFIIFLQVFLTVYEKMNKGLNKREY